MSKPLSYQSTRCVLQYFDSTERFLLTSRCPTIKPFEKSIPLRLKDLKFTSDSIVLNDLRFRLHVTVSMIRCGKGEVLSTTCSYSVKITKEDQRMMSGERTIAHCTTLIHIPKNEALEKLACILLGGRNTVYAEKMQIQYGYPEDIEWPTNFQVVMDMLLSQHHPFEYVLPIVSDTSSLEYLESQFSNKESFDNELVKRAGTLSISKIDESCYPKLSTLRNKETSSLDSSLPKEVIISIVKKWIEEGRQIGTFFEIRYDENDEEDEEDIMYTLKNRFEGRYAPKLSDRDHNRLCFSLSSSSNIVIFHKGIVLYLRVESVRE
ncbi:hypothetical protein GCK72_007262 [Caenorhabditis remanei]|uniref:F-box associated domain-containing protein n=1 Tax=Caenorhabditis remanei TaxID=31234 RepID=A0A6A5HLP8_CAERE|nr:hypothetical protein GCK72_007262 [Caenorhabditis remanei]KAF1767303.1 hypothetical protein GCK72_007262 [Caenorhabditis remanei]